MNKSVKQFIKRLRDEYADFSVVPGPHVRLYTTEGALIGSLPSTPSDHRSLRNAERQLRRAFAVHGVPKRSEQAADRQRNASPPPPLGEATAEHETSPEGEKGRDDMAGMKTGPSEGELAVLAREELDRILYEIDQHSIELVGKGGLYTWHTARSKHRQGSIRVLTKWIRLTAKQEGRKLQLSNEERLAGNLSQIQRGSRFPSEAVLADVVWAVDRWREKGIDRHPFSKLQPQKAGRKPKPLKPLELVEAPAVTSASTAKDVVISAPAMTQPDTGGASYSIVWENSTTKKYDRSFADHLLAEMLAEANGHITCDAVREMVNVAERAARLVA